MNASRFALAGLTLGVILVALLPTTDPLSPVAQGPMSGPGQVAAGWLASEPRPASNDRLLHSTGVALAKDASSNAWGAPDLPDVAVATCPHREAETLVGTAHGQPSQQPTGRLRLAESRLKQMLISWRKSSNGHAGRTGNVLQQPCLDDLAGLMPEARLDEPAKLVSCRDLDRDQLLRVARTAEPRSSPLPGLIIPASYDSAPLARRADSGGASDVAAPDLRQSKPARKLPGLAPWTRCRIAIGDWIAQRVRPLAGTPDRQSARPPVPLPGHLQQP